MNDLELWSKDKRFGLLLKKNLLQKGIDECTNAYSQETGGILVGYYTPECNCAIVTELSGPPKDSIRKSRFFQRGTQGLQRWIQQLWQEKKHFYLGEWHFHPGGTSAPSSDDIEQMKRFSLDKKLQCPEPILLIIGGNPQGEWTASAFVFPVSQKYVPLLPIAAPSKNIEK
jgi:integrative and conjugative element protein (TIGR02256 family)